MKKLNLSVQECEKILKKRFSKDYLKELEVKDLKLWIEFEELKQWTSR